MNMNMNINMNTFIKKHFATLKFWVSESFFSWAFMCSKGSASRAARYMNKVQAFIATFCNGEYDWLVYFNDAILQRNKMGMKAPAV